MNSRESEDVEWTEDVKWETDEPGINAWERIILQFTDEDIDVGMEYRIGFEALLVYEAYMNVFEGDLAIDDVILSEGCL